MMIQKFMKMLFLPFSFLLVSCLFGWTDGTSVTMQNKTDKKIVIHDFSPMEDVPEFPIEVAANSTYTFETGRSPEQYTFTVEIDGKRYDSETQYVQDWRKFSVVFAVDDSEDCGIVCTLDKDGYKLDLRAIE